MGATVPDWSAVFRRRGDHVTREVAGETIVVPIRGSLADLQRVFALNPVAACIWERLDGRRDLAAARDAVLERFDAPRQRVEADLLSFVDQALRAGLIEPAAP